MSSTIPTLVLAGRLEAIALADIVQILSAARRDGVLTIEREDPPEQGAIRFSAGRVVGAEIAGSTDRVGSALLRRRVLDPDLLGEAVRRQSNGLAFKPLGTVLLEMGAIEMDVLAQVLAEEIEAKVSEILTWNEGVFRFRVAHDELSRSTDSSFGVALDPQSLLLEAARRWDEAGREH
ncbi:MAG: DUF4388 domain-containing protein [Acidobacteriota bacterium]